MKAKFGQSTTLFGASGVLPPRWGLGFVGDVACYKHVAPMALSHDLRKGQFACQVCASEKLKTAQHAPLVEKGLALHLGVAETVSDGYKLAADWAQHYDAAHGNGLNGPSRGKLQELVRFMFNVEAREEEK